MQSSRIVMSSHALTAEWFGGLGKLTQPYDRWQMRELAANLCARR